MTQGNIRANVATGSTDAGWATESYDGTTHYGDVARALIPASLILAVTTALLLALI